MVGLSVSNSAKSCYSCKQGSSPKCVRTLSGPRSERATPRLPCLLTHGLFAMQFSPALWKHGGGCHSFSSRRHLMKWQWPQIKEFQPFHLQPFHLRWLWCHSLIPKEGWWEHHEVQRLSSSMTRSSLEGARNLFVVNRPTCKSQGKKIACSSTPQ